jgi:hypothetical protein
VIRIVDPEGRRSIAMVDSAAWIEVWEDGELPRYRVELHRPTRETSVGTVDRPQVCRAEEIEGAVDALLSGQASDRREIVDRLEARWR